MDITDARPTTPVWDEVVSTHAFTVYRFAYRLTRDRQEAQDLAQDVFLRVFRSMSSYNPGTFEGWLYRITLNLFLDGLRRKKKIRFQPIGDERNELPSLDPGPAQLMDDRVLDEDVRRALDALSPVYRSSVMLCDIQGLTYQEIAIVHGVSTGTVGSRIHRGRRQLRTALAHRGPRRLGTT